MVQLYQAYAYALAAHVLRFAVARKRKRHVVERLLAIALGPPQARVPHAEIERAAHKVRGRFGDKRALTAPALDPHAKAVQYGRVGGPAVAQVHERLAVGRYGQRGVVGLQYARGPALLKPYPAPHARREEAPHYVPAEGGGRHAQHGELVVVQHGGEVEAARHVERRAYAHRQAVLPAVVERVGHVEFVRYQGVVAAPYQNVVYVHLGEVVQPLEHQRPARAAARGRVKAALELPAVELVLAEAVQVVGIERVRLHARALEVQLHIAGHMRANALPLRAQRIQPVAQRCGLQCVVQLPFAVQRQHPFVHARPSFLWSVSQ